MLCSHYLERRHELGTGGWWKWRGNVSSGHSSGCWRLCETERQFSDTASSVSGMVMILQKWGGLTYREPSCYTAINKWITKRKIFYSECFVKADLSYRGDSASGHPNGVNASIGILMDFYAWSLFSGLNFSCCVKQVQHFLIVQLDRWLNEMILLVQESTEFKLCPQLLPPHNPLLAFRHKWQYNDFEVIWMLLKLTITNLCWPLTPWCQNAPTISTNGPEVGCSFFKILILSNDYGLEI